jgi:hypothetical protein
MNGLYRYALGDVVRVHDFIGQVPLIEFRYRSGTACSLTGERMSEAEVMAALRAVLDTLDAGASEASLYPCYQGTPRYVLLLDTNEHISMARVEGIAGIVDQSLAENVNYAFHRQKGVVGPAAVEMLTPGTFAAWRQEQCLARTSALPQQKHRVVLDEAQHDALLTVSDRLRHSQPQPQPQSTSPLTVSLPVSSARTLES